MKYRRTSLILALGLLLLLSGCGGNGGSEPPTPSGSGASGGASAVEPVEPVESGSTPAEPTGSSSAPAEGKDVTAKYQDQLMGDYSGEHGTDYRFAKDGALTVVNQVDGENEFTEGTWWVWQEGKAVYLYTNLKGTAHPSRYTFEVSEKGVLSLYDDTTEELSDLLTPYTCGVFP